MRAPLVEGSAFITRRTSPASALRTISGTEPLG